ncbi:hypothetical protein [Streptomyces sp. ST2-7A]|uniref:hypothetical protein n=1 Tax=Streptomyces sp. ST2-7A TaxID=2907214 RepID=UPI001F30539D|nr:hypothetical protein [Streptomyces sp. ST2-7A]MCE7079767.1 hypothetical protein [Streptomyces sp. ST2-7A]
MRIRVGVTMCGTALAVLLPVGVIQSAEAVTGDPLPPLAPPANQATGGGPPTTGAEVISALLAELPAGAVGIPPRRPPGDLPGGTESGQPVDDPMTGPGASPVPDAEERPGGVGTGMVPMGSANSPGVAAHGPDAPGSPGGGGSGVAAERQVLWSAGGGTIAGGPADGEAITLSGQFPGGGPGAGDHMEPAVAGGDGVVADSTATRGSEPTGSAAPGTAGQEDGTDVASEAFRPPSGGGAVLPVLPLGTGLTCLGLGLAILAWHLRRAARL